MGMDLLFPLVNTSTLQIQQKDLCQPHCSSRCPTILPSVQVQATSNMSNTDTIKHAFDLIDKDKSKVLGLRLDGKTISPGDYISRAG